MCPSDTSRGLPEHMCVGSGRDVVPYIRRHLPQHFFVQCFWVLVRLRRLLYSYRLDRCLLLWVVAKRWTPAGPGGCRGVGCVPHAAHTVSEIAPQSRSFASHSV